MDGSASRAEGKREEGNRVKDIDAGPRWVAKLEHVLKQCGTRPSQKPRRMGPHIFSIRVLHRNIRPAVTSKDKSGHAEDHVGAG